MTRQLFRLYLFLLVCFSISVTATAQTVDIPDPNLRAAIEAELGKAPGDTITMADIANLTTLSALFANISDLTGLEAATNLTELLLADDSISDISPLKGLTNLTELYLSDSSISDISPLAGLNNLTELSLGFNSISDISPLAGLNNLTELFLADNSIADISPLAGLNNLTELSLGFNSISDISPLAGLNNLTELFLADNSIADISPLAGLNNLTELFLANNSISDISALSGLINLIWLSLLGNSISDISPLVANTGLGQGDAIIVNGNPLNNASINTHIPALQRRGVRVDFDDLDLTPVDIPDPNLRTAIEKALRKASGVTITTEDIANLTTLSALFANISDLTGLEAATNLTELLLADDSISDISPLKGLTNLTELYLSDSSISDISPLAGLNNLTELSLGFNSISDISPLAGLNNLTELFLANNSIADISPLAGLNNLTELFLANNSIADISPLAGLNNLTRLSLDYNSISDISALSGLINLIWLSLLGNSISDISPLVANTGLGQGDAIIVNGNPLNNASINTHIPALQRRGVRVDFDDLDLTPVDIPDTNLRAAIEKALRKASGATITTEDIAYLTRLSALFANISDLTGLEAATNLTELFLANNSIADISPLAGLNNLTLLSLDYNPISDISALSGLINLIWLSLLGNSISDISPLVANTGLGQGDAIIVNGNPLNNASINTHIPALQRRGVRVDFDDPFDKPVDIPDSNLRTAIEKALRKASGVTITTEDMKSLYELEAPNASITDLTGLEHATSLTWLILNNNSISDISPLKGLTNLVRLDLNNNSISDISPLVANTGLGPGNAVLVEGNLLNNASINTHIPTLISRGVRVDFDNPFDKPVDIPDSNLRTAIEKALGKASGVTITTEWMKRLYQLIAPNASITDLTGLEGATKLTWLELHNNFISDISPLAGLNNLAELYLSDNSISDISPLAGLTNLRILGLSGNSISDISPVAGLINLIELSLENNSISDISPLAGLTNLRILGLSGNSISDISPVAGLINLIELSLENNSISDISPLVANAGLGSGDTVDVSENPLNSQSINTHIPTLQSRGVNISFSNLKPITSEYTLSIPSGYSLIHVPLKVNAVDGVAKTITSIGDLYDVLGGANAVKLLLTLDSQTQEWFVYFGPLAKGTPADRELTDDMGIIADMKTSVSVRLTGNQLGTNGNSTITLNPGYNLVGLPLNDSRLTHVSDLFMLEGIGGNAPMVIFTDNGAFKAVVPAGGPDDIPIIGGQAFILDAQQAATITISGDGWTNTSGTAAAPPLSLTGIEVRDTTLVLGLSGSIVDEETGLKVEGFRVTVKNLSTDRAVAAVTAPDEAGYRLTIVDIETGRAATIGDTLEISAQSPNPFIGVEPLRYTITAEDVKRSRIQLPELVAYEIPAETQLLPNYPNPFNPETWIPYRLAEDTFVTLTVYDLNGQAVRTIDVGHQTAAVYESRSKAIYWDGRNGLGEQVASGVYFYHLSAGDYSATRKMLILK